MKKNGVLYIALLVAFTALGLIGFQRLGWGEYLNKTLPVSQQTEVTTETAEAQETLSPELKRIQEKNQSRLVSGCFAGKDCVPAIDAPKFVSSAAAKFVKDEDKVIGIVSGDEARAYPVKILNWHQIVNDKIGDKDVVVTYCPLCGSAAVFEAGVTGDFGVSGMLLNNNLVMYDKKTLSYWSQMTGEALTGPQTGENLKKLPSSLQPWNEWRTAHPKTKVLSTDTGFDRDYNLYPYEDYEVSPVIYFPVERTDNRLPTKTLVFGVIDKDGKATAYPEDELTKAMPAGFAEMMPQSSYWFCWAAFYPNSEIYKAPVLPVTPSV